MNKANDMGKEPRGSQYVGTPEQEKGRQLPRLTVWEVARDTGMGVITDKTGSGADSHGMRDVILSG